MSESEASELEEVLAQACRSSWLNREENAPMADLYDDIRTVLTTLRALPVEDRMEAMGMEPTDGWEVFVADDGGNALRVQSGLWRVASSPSDLSEEEK